MRGLKIKKIIGLLVILILIITYIFFITYKPNKDNNSNDMKNIEIVVYDKEKKQIFDEKINTEKEKLIDVLKEISKLKIESVIGPYGEYIVSINDIKQADGYYWNYYINSKYASVGVSSYIVKENDIIKFNLEKFEEN